MPGRHPAGRRDPVLRGDRGRLPSSGDQEVNLTRLEAASGAETTGCGARGPDATEPAGALSETPSGSPAMAQYVLLFLLGAVALAGVWWTVWDVRSDLRRKRLK